MRETEFIAKQLLIPGMLSRSERINLLDLIRYNQYEWIGDVIRHVDTVETGGFRRAVLRLESMVEKDAASACANNDRVYIDQRLSSNSTAISREISALFTAAGPGPITIIGAGAVPISCMIATRHTSSTVFGIDRDKTAVKHAGDVVKRYGLADRICLLVSYAHDVDRYPSTPYVVVAGHIASKHSLLQRLRERSSFVSVVVREGLGSLASVYTPLERTEDFFGIETIQSNARFRSILVTL